MSNSDAADSLTDLATKPAAADTVVAGYGAMWNSAFERESQSKAGRRSSGSCSTLPQYSWRRKAIAEARPSVLIPDSVNPRYLVRKKDEILHNIAEEYSKLVRLMHDEIDVTGIEPFGYAESLRAYEKAVDDYECFQIYLDSLVVTASHESEVGAEKGKQNLQRRTSHALSPTVLRKLAYGSLQNIARPQEEEHRCPGEHSGLTNGSAIQPRSRGNSVPREVAHLAAPRSATVSGATATVRPQQEANLDTLQKASTSWSRPTLRRFFSLRSLTDSLHILGTRTSSGIARLFAEENAGDEEQIMPRALASAGRTETNDLTTRKNFDVAPAQNIIKANMAREMDAGFDEKARSVSRDCPQGTQWKLHHPSRESGKPKETSQPTMAPRSLSVGRFDSLSPFPSPSLTQVPTAKHPDGDQCRRRLPSCAGDAVNSTFVLPAGEPCPEAFHSSAKQAHVILLSASCHSSGPFRALDLASSNAKNASCLLESHDPPPKAIHDPVAGMRLRDLNDAREASRAPATCVRYLFPDQRNIATMRSYGRPNYSRHRSEFAPSGNQDPTQLPRCYSSQDGRVHCVYQTFGYYFPRTPLANSKHCLVQYSNSPAPSSLGSPATRSSPTHFNKYPRGVKLISELDRITANPSHQPAAPERTPTPSTRPRFTLADKLNMCTTSSH